MDCAEGPHPLIDATEFQTQYWTYSIKLEASVADKVKLGGELAPNRSSRAMRSENGWSIPATLAPFHRGITRVTDKPSRA